MNLDEFKAWIEEEIEVYGEYLDKQQCGTLEWAYAYGCYESVSCIMHQLTEVVE